MSDNNNNHNAAENASRMMNWPFEKQSAAAPQPPAEGAWDSMQRHVSNAGDDIKSMASHAGQEIQKTAGAIDRKLGGHVGFGAAPEPQQQPGFSSDRMVHWPFESKKE